MSDIVAEQPLIVAVMLAAIGGALVFGWLQTGKKPALVIGAIVLAMIPVAFLVAAKWHTDREQIEAIIYETADAVEKNDYERAYKIIGDTDAQAMARTELPQFEFTMARVNKLRSIDIVEGSFPPAAEADLSVKVDVSSKRFGIRNVRVVRRLMLKFEKVDGSWIVTGYRHLPIVGGPDQFTTEAQFPTR